MWAKAELNLSRSWWKFSLASAKSNANTLPPHLPTKSTKLGSLPSSDLSISATSNLRSGRWSKTNWRWASSENPAKSFDLVFFFWWILRWCIKMIQVYIYNYILDVVTWPTEHREWYNFCCFCANYSCEYTWFRCIYLTLFWQ